MAGGVPENARAWVGLVARLVTGGVWIWAGGAKLPHPEQSVAAVRAYEILPGTTATPVGHLLPVVEVVVGGLLVLGLLTRFAGAVSSLLFLAFVAGIVSVWARGITIDCGCFGGGGYDPNAASKYPWEIARDGGLLLLSLFLAWQGRTRLSLDGLLFPPTSVNDLDLVDVEDDENDDQLDQLDHSGA